MKVYRRTVPVILQGDRVPLFPFEGVEQMALQTQLAGRRIKSKGSSWDLGAERIPSLRFRKKHTNENWYLARLGEDNRHSMADSLNSKRRWGQMAFEMQVSAP